jgi:urease subunit alpha
MFGSYGKAMAASCITFVSQAAIEGRVAERLGLSRAVLPVIRTRGIGKADMKLNDAVPDIRVDPETYEVRADGELLTCEPATELPLAQRYFLY